MKLPSCAVPVSSCVLQHNALMNAARSLCWRECKVHIGRFLSLMPVLLFHLSAGVKELCVRKAESSARCRFAPVCQTVPTYCFELPCF